MRNKAATQPKHFLDLDVLPASELRNILEHAVLEKVGREAGTRQIAGLRRMVEEERDCYLNGDRPRWIRLSAQFHLALAEASGNVVIAAMMAGLRTAIESYVQAAAATIEDWDATAQRLRAEHRAIIDAVDVGDAAHARALVHEHITGYYAQAGLARRTQ